MHRSSFQESSVFFLFAHKTRRWSFLLCLVFAAATSHAQLRTKPAQKAIQAPSGNLHRDESSACKEAVAPKIAAGTFRTTQPSSCAGGVTGTSVSTSTAVFTRFEVATRTSDFACYVRYTQSFEDGCGSPPASTNFEADDAHVREVRVCDQASGWRFLDASTCVQPGKYPPAKDAPRCGNPTAIGSGCKQETFTFYQLHAGSRSVAIELRYGNQFHLSGGSLLGEPSWFLDPADRRLDLGLINATVSPRVTTSRGHGITEEFQRLGDGSYRSFDSQVVFTATTSTSTPWKRVDYRDNLIELYDAMGRLLSLRYFEGGGFDMGYASASALLPSTLTSVTGQQLTFTYAAGRLSAVRLPNGRTLSLTYQLYTDAEKRITDTYLKTIGYSDGKSTEFDYVAGMTLPAFLTSQSLAPNGMEVWQVPPNTPATGILADSIVTPLPHGRSFFNLSGVKDENGAAYAGFQYDTDGRVLVSQHAGGTYRYEFDYQDNQTVVTQPLGLVTTFNFLAVNEQLNLDNQTRTATVLPNGSHTVQFGYDNRGNQTQRIDVGAGNGSDVRAQCKKVDTATNRPVIVLEGASSCPGDLTAYAPTSSERKTSIAWNTAWRVETQRAEPGKRTTRVYNGQPDPFNANAIATCAPSTALLPDGKPIVVLCKQVEQATTDANGSMGFTATLQAGVANVVTQWTYDTYGQMLTAKDELNNTTTYAYYTDTSFTGTDPNAVGHTTGDLKSVTNTAGQVTQYLEYDKHGIVLKNQDALGAQTVNTYDARQRLLTSAVASRTTSYAYDGAGQLTKATQPDGSWIGYEYDDAHRMKALKDNLGNRIEYTLDAMGNRTAENSKDPSGALKRAHTRTLDALSRIQQSTGK